MSTETRLRWHDYLIDTPTYGTFEQRCPEYALVTRFLQMRGLQDDDMIVDVGAGSCDMDHFLRVKQGWRGKYFPVDGATIGIDFNEVSPEEYLLNAQADFYVSIETLEHVYDPVALVEAMKKRASKAVVITTPNAAVVDVVAVDSTHVMPISKENLEAWGFTVFTFQLNDRHPEDTLLGLWFPAAAETEEYLPERG